MSSSKWLLVAALALTGCTAPPKSTFVDTKYCKSLVSQVVQQSIWEARKDPRSFEISKIDATAAETGSSICGGMAQLRNGIQVPVHFSSDLEGGPGVLYTLDMERAKRP